ncbi:LysE family transporter [Paenibacillus barcinonensis]|uniref:LysE family transporter n=1 Tax=Paenibacillus barcinonensis TaxID=198119 RepID=A0A2V4V944_PAEBA|nr:LysE family translocator [Paenibacillus barcinonensis]PYE49181.1 threonine/homoserine/homoserine lactone efflux protein [Paenibacillus barcinonensis]QKS55416.1 LysE family transporter [Paenibacillus barcinonensis]
MTVLFSYIFLGISLSAPVGPINAAQLDRGARHGFMHAWVLGLGAMFADLVYMLLIYFGIAHFLSTPFMQAFLWSFGSFILIYTGVETLLKYKRDITNASLAESKMHRSFITGFLMALSNPLNILFWLGIYGSVLTSAVKHTDMAHVLLYSSGIFIGILIWDVVMAGMASRFHRRNNETILRWISVISGISLIGFGLYFANEAIRYIFF